MHFHLLYSYSYLTFIQTKNEYRTVDKKKHVTA